MTKKTHYTVKQMEFIEAYNGNVVETAEKVGINAVYARRLVTMPKIRKKIRARVSVYATEAIADRDARQRFWTQVMLDESQGMGDRLKASELLGKSNGDFWEQRNVHVDVQLSSLISQVGQTERVALRRAIRERLQELAASPPVLEGALVGEEEETDDE